MNLVFEVIIFAIGVILISLAVMKDEKKCPPQKVEYRFVPRTFEEEQRLPVKSTDIFKDMFDKPTPWIGSRHIGRDVSRDNINANFISQL